MSIGKKKETCDMVDVLLIVGEQVTQEAERLHRHLHLSVGQQPEHLQSKNAFMCQ